MFLYLFIFFVCLILAVSRNRQLQYANNTNSCLHKQNYSVVLTIFIFACISGFRYKLGGTDYDYYGYFYGLINGERGFLATLSDSQYEVGYTAFVYLCANVLHLSFEGSLVVEALIFYILMYVGLKKYMPNWGIFLMFFMYKMFFYVTFVAMRQAFTVAGFFVIMRFLEERKPLKYYTSLALVATFHYGALLLFVLYPIFGLKIKKERLKTIAVIFGVSTIFSSMTGTLLNFVVNILGLSQLEDKAAGYSGGAGLNILYTIEYFLLYIFMVRNYDKIKQRFQHADFVIMLFLMVLPIVTLFRSTVILVRELPYFYPAYAILLYYVFAVSKNRRIIFPFFVILCLSGILKYIIQFDDGHFMHYKTWLFNPNVYFLQ